MFATTPAPKYLDLLPSELGVTSRPLRISPITQHPVAHVNQPAETLVATRYAPEHMHSLQLLQSLHTTDLKSPHLQRTPTQPSLSMTPSQHTVSAPPPSIPILGNNLPPIVTGMQLMLQFT